MNFLHKDVACIVGLSRDVRVAPERDQNPGILGPATATGKERAHIALDKKLPGPGDRLVHRFRKKPGEVVAEVISSDEKTGKVTVRVSGKDYSSLSAAAEAQTGHSTNGWIYWGLKKMLWRPQ